MKPMRELWKELSNELKVAIVINRMNEEADEIPYFSSILEKINEWEKYTPTRLHNALDHLIDIGQIDAEWSRTKEDPSQWVRHFYITSPKDFVKRISDDMFGLHIRGEEK